MKNIVKHSLPVLGGGLALALIIGPAAAVDGASHPVPQKTAVSGYLDWSIIPVNLGPYLIVGTDGDLYIRHLPLVGPFTLAGRGISLEAKIQVDFNAEFDATGTGVIWMPVTITDTIDGVKTIIFEGQARGHEVNLIASATVSLAGRGPYEGSKLEIIVEELGPGDSNTYTFTGELSPAPRR
ncbi:MAG TPA: hypothetical protein PLX89_18120 [Verrucomicrobiota bacterium]|nr:hypothetical protein [Verrucomicrobiales bacterium]HRI14917.1 hypothetical protein [Verrucomicrobiota bacterium]